MVFALAGDSTITKFFCISIFCWLEIGCKLTQIINVRSISITKKAFFPIHYIYSMRRMAALSRYDGSAATRYPPFDGRRFGGRRRQCLAAPAIRA